MKNLDFELKNLMYKDPTKLLFLCGAGISLDEPTSLPTVSNFISEILNECGVEAEIVEKVKQSKFYYRFESLIEEIRKLCDHEKTIEKIFNSSSFNKNHSFLAQMLAQGATVVTTNFDNCIENAAKKHNLFFNRITYQGRDLDQIPSVIPQTLVKIHGTHPLEDELPQELVITISALAKTDRAFLLLPNWREYMMELLKDKIVVVMGYSGSDDFDIMPLLSESALSKILWLNYLADNNYPIYNPNISNTNINIKNISEKLNVKCYDGLLIHFLELWGKELNFVTTSGFSSHNYSVKDFISQKHNTKEKKMIISNQILLCYNLFDDICYDINNYDSLVQAIKANFRLGNYDKAIDLCEIAQQLKQIEDSELLYYLASSLCRMNDYRAIEVAEKCIVISEQENDLVSKLNMMLNYAAILSYFADVDVDKKTELLDKAEQAYHFVIKNSEGVSIELQASALWGLGYLINQKYQQPSKKQEALSLLYTALPIHQKIGNKYAVDIICATIEEIENQNAKTGDFYSLSKK